MSYIHYDPTNSAGFEDFVPNQQIRRNKIIKWVVIGGATAIALYFLFRKPDRNDDEEIRES